jgi:hypothetical protein
MALGTWLIIHFNGTLTNNGSRPVGITRIAGGTRCVDAEDFGVNLRGVVTVVCKGNLRNAGILLLTVE